MSCFGPSGNELALEEEVKELRAEIEAMKRKDAENKALLEEREKQLAEQTKNLNSLSADAKAQVEANLAAAAAAEKKEKELLDKLERDRKQAAAVEEAVRMELEKYKREVENERHEAERLKAETEAASSRAKAEELAKKAAEAKATQAEEKEKAAEDAAASDREALKQLQNAAKISATHDKENWQELQKVIDKAKEADEAAKKAEEELKKLEETAALTGKKLVLDTYAAVFCRLSGASEDPETALLTGYKAIVHALGNEKQNKVAKVFAKETAAKYKRDGITGDAFAAEMAVKVLELRAQSNTIDRPELDIAQETCACMEHHWEKAKKKHIIIARLVAIIRRHDLNGDGQIDKKEFSIYASVCADLVLLEAMKQLPPGGEITKDNVKTMIMESFTEEFFDGKETVPLDRLEDALEGMAANMSSTPEGIDSLDQMEKACMEMVAKKEQEIIEAEG